jgi:hypothetical protein
MALFAAGQKLTAAALNAIFPAIITQNMVAASISVAAQATASVTYVDLATAGPSVTITSQGSLAIVFFGAQCITATGGNGAISSVAVSGATTLTAAANDTAGNTIRGSAVSPGSEFGNFMVLTITPGTNTYKQQYRTDHTAAAASFTNRKILVWAP